MQSNLLLAYRGDFVDYAMNRVVWPIETGPGEVLPPSVRGGLEDTPEPDGYYWDLATSGPAYVVEAYSARSDDESDSDEPVGAGDAGGDAGGGGDEPVDAGVVTRPGTLVPYSLADVFSPTFIEVNRPDPPSILGYLE